jgi:hypothetical protein
MGQTFQSRHTTMTEPNNEEEMIRVHFSYNRINKHFYCTTYTLKGVQLEKIDLGDDYAVFDAFKNALEKEYGAKKILPNLFN